MPKGETSTETTSEKNLDSKARQPRKKRKLASCHIEGCSGRVVPLMGDCKWCRHSYCQEHRLPEAHQCESLVQCNRAAREANDERLREGRCVASKLATV